ncbi:MAG: ABC transporter ATP-binding protein [Vicinamibacterales bacterium]
MSLELTTIGAHPVLSPALATAPDRTPARPLLALESVSLRYGSIVALDHVSLAVETGEILCLLGPSGSGKSTLLRLVAGVERPTAGRIRLDGSEVAGPRTFVEPERRRVGMVFQDYALFPHITNGANVAFGLKGLSREGARQAAIGMLERVGLARYADSYPHMLSGGERQRVALARALAPKPRLLLMDEPFSSLDGSLRDQVRSETIALLRELGTTTLLVTHDPDEAMRVADRIALLHNGCLVQCARPRDLYAHPASTFAARTFGDINELKGDCRGGCVETPLGVFAAPGIPDGVQASVCIRPQHLRIARHGGGAPARVLTTSFLGEVDHVVLTVPGLEWPVAMRVFGRSRLEPGDNLHVEVDADDVLVITHDKSR